MDGLQGLVATRTLGTRRSVNADRYLRAKQLFQAALDIDASQRDQFLRDACGHDHELRDEIWSLLSHHDSETIISPRAAAEETHLAPNTPAKNPLARLAPLRWKDADPRGLRASAVALVVALGLLALGLWLNAGVARRLRTNLSGQLQSTLDSNVAALTMWLETQQQESEKYATDARVRHALPAIAESARSPGSLPDSLPETQPYRDMLDAVSPLLERDDIADVGATDTAGKVLFSARYPVSLLHRVSPAGEAPLAAIIAGRPAMLPPIQGNSLVNDVKLEIEKIPIIIVGYPVRDEEGTIVGGLFLSIESERDFTRLLDLGRSGLRSDTYAFGRQGQLLSASRYEPDLRKIGLLDDSQTSTSVLQVKLLDPGVDLTAGRSAAPSLDARPLTRMAASAIAGNDGIDLDGYRDYRGVEVVGAWNWLEKYGFGVATEIEYDEAYAALKYVRRSLWTLFSLASISALVAMAFALSAARLRREIGVARQLGPYSLEELIGEGGMGKVYKARHALLKRPTAVKVLEGARADPMAIARFEREVQTASSLSHPNTVEIYDYGRSEEGIFYFAMEYLPGVNLEELIRREGPICPARALHILRQILGSLSEAHRQGLIHRDMKPGNVILCERGGVSDFVKVVDFGLAKEPPSNLSAEITHPGLISGTPLYIAPELLDDPQSLSPRSDVYAVGAVGFYLLTGRELFVAANNLEIFHCALRGDRPRPSDVVPDGIPPALDELIHRCVAKDPADRPASASDMLAVVDAIIVDNPWSQADADRCWQRLSARTGASTA
jgi:eukaryotic-like serine/threonine-protein kinase